MSYSDDVEDITYSLAPDAGWTMIEMSAAVVSASLPAIGPVMIEAWTRLHRYWHVFTSRLQHVTIGQGGRFGKANQATERGDGAPIGPGRQSGSFYLLEDLNVHNINPTVKSPAVVNESTSSDNGQIKKDEAGYSLNAESNEAGGEVPFNVVQVRRSKSQPSTRLAGET